LVNLSQKVASKFLKLLLAIAFTRSPPFTFIPHFRLLPIPAFPYILNCSAFAH
jgi:hypothetical protein